MDHARASLKLVLLMERFLQRLLLGLFVALTVAITLAPAIRTTRANFQAVVEVLDSVVDPLQ